MVPKKRGQPYTVENTQKSCTKARMLKQYHCFSGDNFNAQKRSRQRKDWTRDMNCGK